MRGVAFVTLVTIAFAGCVDDEPPASGAEGMVWIGPICPVEQNPPDPNCADRPFETDLVAVEAQGRSVPFSSDGDGKFRVPLAPGSYVIRSPSQSASPPTCQSEPFVVTAKVFTNVDVQCDSGIR